MNKYKRQKRKEKEFFSEETFSPTVCKKKYNLKEKIRLPKEKLNITKKKYQEEI
jgi:hypothetical protein